MKHMINHQYIEVADIQGACGPNTFTRVLLVVNGRQMPYHCYAALTNGEYIKNRKRALAMATRLGKQLGMEVHAP